MHSSDSRRFRYAIPAHCGERAYQLELANGLQYPEEIPFLADAEPSYDMKLAASMFLSAQSELLETNEASAYLSEKLTELSRKEAV